jgi:hypothetical protein
MRAAYQTRIKRHLATYKRNRLGVAEDGLWRGNGQPYGHILPKSLRKLNILEGIRAEFWDFWKSTGSKLHEDFHHLNSSQAMCFNLFFPLMLKSTGSSLLPRILGLGSEPVIDTAFEKIPDRQEGTNFDFYAELGSGRRVFVEMKLSEADFGSAEADARHLGKLQDIYAARLKGKVSDAALIPKTFFKNYQLLRNISFVDATRDDLLLLVFPRANTALATGARFVEEHLTSVLRRHVSVLYIEEILAQILGTLKAPSLQAHYGAFQEKYIITGVSA